MPWWSSGSIIDTKVVSWPPCRLAVEVKSAAGLPASAPFSHRSEVPSQKCFIEAARLAVRRAGRRNGRLGAFGDARDARHGAQPGGRAFDFLDAARDPLGHLAPRAAMAVVENQDVAHRKGAVGPLLL